MSSLDEQLELEKITLKIQASYNFMLQNGYSFKQLLLYL